VCPPSCVTQFLKRLVLCFNRESANMTIIHNFVFVSTGEWSDLFLRDSSGCLCYISLGTWRCREYNRSLVSQIIQTF